ncbi:MAG: anti-sigma factor [Chthonomonadales bacterium]
MNCRKISSLMSAYMDGELPGVEHQNIHEHIKCCSSCREEYETLLCTKRMLSTLKAKVPAKALEDQILGKLAVERSNQPVGMRPTVWWSMLSYPQRMKWSAASAAFGVTVLMFSINRTPIKPTPGPLAGLAPAPKIGVDYVPQAASMQNIEAVSNDEMVFIHNPSDNAPSYMAVPSKVRKSASNPSAPKLR